jgi:signal transduction histidine kinase
LLPSILAIPAARAQKKARSAIHLRDAILGPASSRAPGGGVSLASAGQTRASVESRCGPEVAQGEGLLHDAQNLLGAVGLYCDLLSAPGVLKPEHRRYAVELRLAGSRSCELLGRLTRLSQAPAAAADRRSLIGSEANPVCSTVMAAREDAGRAGASPARPVTLRMIVDRCSGLLGQVAGGRAIEVRYGPAASVRVLVPEETIERILVNLVRNAAAGLKEAGDGDASGLPPPGARIASESVVVRESSDGTEDETPGAIRIGAGLTVNRAGDSRPWSLRRVRLTVEDSGCGMTLAHLDRVLNPNEEAARGGHGMGLRVVRELVSASGGELSAMSAPGVGTRVQIDWPAVATAPSEAIEGGRCSSVASFPGGQTGSLGLSQPSVVRMTQKMSNGRGKRTVAGILVKAGIGSRPHVPVSATFAGRRIPC